MKICDRLPHQNLKKERIDANLSYRLKVLDSRSVSESYSSSSNSEVDLKGAGNLLKSTSKMLAY